MVKKEKARSMDSFTFKEQERKCLHNYSKQRTHLQNIYNSVDKLPHRDEVIFKITLEIVLYKHIIYTHMYIIELNHIAHSESL